MSRLLCYRLDAAASHHFRASVSVAGGIKYLQRERKAEEESATDSAKGGQDAPSRDLLRTMASTVSSLWIMLRCVEGLSLRSRTMDKEANLYFFGVQSTLDFPLGCRVCFL